MPTSGPPTTTTAATPSVSGLAGQTSYSQPAMAAAMKTGLANAARRESARDVTGPASARPARGLIGVDPADAVLEQPCDDRRMAWDFSTDPEFQEQLDWMRDLVREEVWPIETVFDELGEDGFRRAIAPLQEQVKERGLWAAHLPPELGGQGFGQVKLGLMHEILGTSPFAPAVFGNAAPDTGNSEILALAGTPDQKERYLQPLLAGDLRSAFSMTEPDTAGSDPTLLQTRAVRDGDEWVINGHKWFSTNGVVADFLIVMAVTDPDARPHQRASMLIVDADTPGVNIIRDVPTMEHPAEHFGRYGGHAEIVYDDVRVPGRRAARRRGRGLPDRPAPARPGPHPPLHALARRVPARVRHALRARPLALRVRLACCPTSRRSRTGSPTRAAQMQAARLMTLHAAWRMDNEGASRRAPTSR